MCSSQAWAAGGAQTRGRCVPLPFVIGVGSLASQQVPELSRLLALGHSVLGALAENAGQLLGHCPLIPTRPLSGVRRAQGLVEHRCVDVGGEATLRVSWDQLPKPQRLRRGRGVCSSAGRGGAGERKAAWWQRAGLDSETHTEVGKSPLGFGFTWDFSTDFGFFFKRKKLKFEKLLIQENSLFLVYTSMSLDKHTESRYHHQNGRSRTFASAPPKIPSDYPSVVGCSPRP